MDIKYFGHSCFKLKSKTGSLITDPFSSEMVGFPLEKLEADICTVSHDHKDHNNTDRINQPVSIIRGPGEYELKGFTIHGYQTFHDDSKGSERGRNTIFSIESDGVRVLHLGDLGHQLDDELLEELDTIHILMIPVGGYFTIDAKTAGKITRQIEPSIVIPMHYKSEKHSTNFSNLASVTDFITEIGKEAENVQKLSFSVSDMKEELRVVTFSL